MTRGTLHLLTPTLRPLGGVVKIMDYAGHALALGYSVKVYCREPWDPELPLFAIERFQHLRPDVDERVEFTDRERPLLQDEDLAFFSLPSSYPVVEGALGAGMSPERIIHIIQGVRHATPAWTDGYALRLLTRPAARIAINQIVMDRIAPHLDARALAEVITIGHDFDYFSTERESGLHSPVRVAYTGWKSDLGARLERKVPAEKFEVRGISHHVSWQELRELYQWADVFLSTPGPEEGLYLPGLEAMAAGAIVITPDAGGNMAYCRPGDNCVLVELEQVDDYADALAAVSGWDDERIRSVRASARRTTEEFDLSREREAFGAFLERLRERIAGYERAGRRAAGTWRPS